MADVVLRLGDRWGPFADALEPAERLARLRSLRAIVRLCCGPRGATAESLLLAAEINAARIPAAAAAVHRLEPTDFRRVGTTYAGLMAGRPVGRAKGEAG